jgi:Dolichyl-phosphate-mannose-protein mannosyltransferase
LIDTPNLDVQLIHKHSRLRYFLLLTIPLSLSAFTHLWNPIGFPYFVGDEGHYIRRSLYFLDQLDPQEGARYDHPYFGQLFLAGLFKIIGYPDSLNPVPGDVNSTQMLYMVPRIIIGLLAVVDTFLIYKICERLYITNKAIAFIGSVLFAVMPFTWLTRRVYLDSIQLPLILLSILLAVYFYNNSKTRDNNDKRPAGILGEFTYKRTLLIIFSGISLGLAIFTKIPALSMIPVVAYLIFRADKKYSERIKGLGLWFVPVILIPAIWPAYAISVGEYDNWYNGVFSQAGREGSGIGSIGILFKIDPVLISIGSVGFIFAIFIRKDFFLLLWIVSFLAFHTAVPWTQHFHWLQVLPAFCIAGGVLIDALASMVGRKLRGRSYDILGGGSDSLSNPEKRMNGIGKLIHNVYSKYKQRFWTDSAFLMIIVLTIIIFGLTSTTMLITTNVNSSYFELVTFISKSLPIYHDSNASRGLCLWCTSYINRYERSGDDNNKAEETNEDNKVTLVGNHWIYGAFWIPKYAYDKDHDFKGFFTRGSVNTDKVVIVADSRLLDAISSANPEEHIAELKSLYDNSTIVETFKEKRPDYDANTYPYQSMSENRGIGKIEVRANY